jgi:hypothetical protein
MKEILFTLEIFQEWSKKIQISNIKEIIINNIRNKKTSKEGERKGPPIERGRCQAPKPIH